MNNYRWSYCLTEEQYSKLYRVMSKVSGLIPYLEERNDTDLLAIIQSYKNYVDSEGISTTGMRVNMEVAMKWYDLYKKEYEESHRTEFSYSTSNMHSILTWNPKPNWAKSMTIQEMDYLDHFIPSAPGLSEFLFEKKESNNLYDLVVFFQMKLNATGINNPDIDFLLETIKERFYRIMDDHKDAIHYVNHSHEIDDRKIIKQFHKEATNGFFITDLEKNISSDFTNRYLQYSNPYIAGELFQRFFRANKVNIALNFAHKVFPYIFSAPNIYWHNKESIYGSVNILFTLIDALDHQGIEKLQDKLPNVKVALLESLYLLLSRTIYWSDKETYKVEAYDDNLMPINVQHKLRAYRLRAYLIDHYGYLIAAGYNETECSMMALADLFSAHEIAYSNKIVGKESVYHWDAVRLFHTKGLFKIGSPEIASEKGFILNDELAQAIHSKYRDGKYCLKEVDISSFIAFCRTYFAEQRKQALATNTPISYLKKDNYSPLYKANKEEILQYLKENCIEFFYHFTERDKIRSIIKYGGLLSYRRCLDEGIVMPLREDMALSRDKDAKLGLEDYSRLSFCKRLPKIRVRQKEGADLVMLKISLDVALFEETIFTDIEATHDSVRYGNTFDDLLRVNLPSTQSVSSTTDSRFLKSQAEILVKGFVPLKYIVNINNPEDIEIID